MKTLSKVLSPVLAMLIAFSMVVLSSCNKNGSEQERNETPTINEEQAALDLEGKMTKEELEATKPGEFLVEKISAGIPVNVEFSGFVDNDAIMGEYAAMVEEVVTGYGAEFHKTHAGGDVVNQITQVENFIEMKTNMIVLVPPDGTTMKDILTKAMDAGITVVTYGASDADYCISTFGYQRLQGYVAAEMMYYWVSEKHPDAAPGSIDVGVFVSRAIQPMVESADGILESINSHDCFNIAYYTDALESTIDSGFNLAETAVTANPEMRYMVFQTPNPACGANNYVMTLPDVKPEEWAISCSAVEGPILEIMEATARGEGVIIGTSTGEKSEGQYIADVVDKAFRGEVCAPYVDLIEYSCVTIDGWSCDFTGSDVPDVQTNT